MTPQQQAEQYAKERMYPNAPNGRPIFYTMTQAWMAGHEAGKPAWAPIAQHTCGHILRYHKLWECLISVQLLSEFTAVKSDDNCTWIESTRGRTWPEEAFEPFYVIPFEKPE